MVINGYHSDKYAEENNNIEAICVCVCVCVCISLSVLLICYLPIHSVSNLETETVSVANCSNVLAKEWISGVL